MIPTFARGHITSGQCAVSITPTTADDSITMYGLIRRGERFGNLHLHLFFAALKFAVTGFGAENFCSADLAFISFPKLTHDSLFM